MERILKTAREKQLVTYKGTPLRLSADFSAHKLQVRRDWHNIFKMIKGKKRLTSNTLRGKVIIHKWKREKQFSRQVALVLKNSPANSGDSGDAGSSPGWGRSSGGGHGNSLQYSCLENSMGRGAWWAPKSRTWLSTLWLWWDKQKLKELITKLALKQMLKKIFLSWK